MAHRLRVSPSLNFDFRLWNLDTRPTPLDSPYLKTRDQMVGIIDSEAKVKLEQFQYFRHDVTSWSQFGPQRLSLRVKNIPAWSSGTQRTIISIQTSRKNKCRFSTIFFLKNSRFFLHIYLSFLQFSVEDPLQKPNQAINMNSRPSRCIRTVIKFG